MATERNLGEQLLLVRRNLERLKEEESALKHLLVEDIESHGSTSMDTGGNKYTVVHSQPFSSLSIGFLREALASYFAKGGEPNAESVTDYVIKSRKRGRKNVSIRVTPLK